MSSVPEYVEAVVDGVPVRWVAADGPITAGLVFRVGAADESLPERGITHLVEHMALSTMGPQSYEYNGSVAPLFTSFTVRGTAEQVARHLRSLCDALASLPADSLEKQARILRLESLGRVSTPLDAALRTRYRLDGFGGVAVDEVALLRNEPPDPRAWAASRFVRGNAILWVMGTPPPDLSLPLRPGARLPAPDPRPRDLTFPAWGTGPASCVMLSMTVARGLHTRCFLAILYRRALQRLRNDEAIAYDFHRAYLPTSERSTEAVLATVSTPSTEAAVARALDEILGSLAEDGPTAAEVEDIVASSRISQADSAADMLHINAERELLGLPTLRPEDVLSRLDGVTRASVQETARQAFATRIILAPEGVEPLANFARVPRYSAQPVAGRTYRRWMVSTGEGFTAGAGGISFRNRGGVFRTIAREDMRLALAWPDGRRQVFTDGADSLVFEPRRWGHGRGGARDIDMVVPQSLWVRATPESTTPLPARSAWWRRLTIPVAFWIGVLALQASNSANRSQLGIILLSASLLSLLVVLAVFAVNGTFSIPIVAWTWRNRGRQHTWEDPLPLPRQRPFPTRGRPRMTGRWWIGIVMCALAGFFIAPSIAVNPGGGDASLWFVVGAAAGAAAGTAAWYRFGPRA